MIEVQPNDPRTSSERMCDFIRFAPELDLMKPVRGELFEFLRGMVDALPQELQEKTAQSLVGGLRLAGLMPEGQRYSQIKNTLEDRAKIWIEQNQYDETSFRYGWIVGCLARVFCLDAVNIAKEHGFDNFGFLFDQAKEHFSQNEHLRDLGFSENLDRVMNHQNNAK